MQESEDGYKSERDKTSSGQGREEEATLETFRGCLGVYDALSDENRLADGTFKCPCCPYTSAYREYASKRYSRVYARKISTPYKRSRSSASEDNDDRSDEMGGSSGPAETSEEAELLELGQRLGGELQGVNPEELGTPSTDIVAAARVATEKLVEPEKLKVVAEAATSCSPGSVVTEIFDQPSMDNETNHSEESGNETEGGASVEIGTNLTFRWTIRKDNPKGSSPLELCELRRPGCFERIPETPVNSHRCRGGALSLMTGARADTTGNGSIHRLAHKLSEQMFTGTVGPPPSDRW